VVAPPVVGVNVDLRPYAELMRTVPLLPPAPAPGAKTEPSDKPSEGRGGPRAAEGG